MNAPDLRTFLLTNVELFKDFPDEKLNPLITGSTIRTFEPKEAIIEYGEINRSFFVLLDGEAEVAVTDDSGDKHRLALIEQGDFFGEISLMTGNRSIVDVIGIRRCKTLFIPEQLFISHITTHPPALRYLTRSITKKMKTWTIHNTDRSLSADGERKSSDPYGFTLTTERPIKILVVNCGSSSLKYSLFDTADDSVPARGSIENIGSSNGKHCFTCGSKKGERSLTAATFADAFNEMIAALQHPEYRCIHSPEEISFIGHRVVHGGDQFTDSTIITDEVIAGIEAAAHLAPLHNPINLLGIKAAQKAFPSARHIAVFDTAFHHTLPPYAYLYGLPYELYKEKKIRRYGFHGTSHFYVSLRSAEFLQRSFNSLNIISCHLGNGASMCAVDHGRSVDTTMGLTPTAGLMMGTRSGDIDPGILIHLMKNEGYTVDQCDKLINRESGLYGISGISNDMRAIDAAAQDGNHRAMLAFKSFCYQVRKNIGAYVAAMQGLDTVIFTGGIGQGSAAVRSYCCQGLECMGIFIDEKKNRAASGSSTICDIAADGTKIRLLVIPTNEELMIARETLRAMRKENITAFLASHDKNPIPIEVSAHHVHLSQEHVELLFGKGHELTTLSDLSQPKQFASKEQVTLVGPKGKVERVRVLGPVRKESQVEIAMTEQFKLGIYPPIRESGDLKDTPGITLTGPAGSVTLTQGVICAMRHIHMSPTEALQYRLRDKYIVRVKVEGDRELVFGDVLIRVSPSYKLAMHIDTDEANAAHITSGVQGVIDGIQSRS